MIRVISLASFAVLAIGLASPAAHGQGTPHPASIIPDGAGPVRLAAHAPRVHLLGTMDLYSIALYADGASADLRVLASPGVPKALRVVVTYKDDLRRRLSIDWRRELIPRLEDAAVTHLRNAFAPLRHGDVVLVEYSPVKGTAIRVNKGVVVSEANHDLMLAFLEHWLGQRPVSEAIKAALLGG